MNPSDVAALVLAILAGLSAFVSALVALLQVQKIARDVGEVKNQLNGRLDQLMAEREQRVRTETAAALERERVAALLRGAGPGRADPVIREVPPEDQGG